MKTMQVLVASIALVTGLTMQARPPYNPTQVEVHGHGSAGMPVDDKSSGNVERTTEAVNYAKSDGLTSVEVRGTALLPEARGEAKVERKQGRVEIEVELDGLQGATRFGPEYLTYVMWGIAPEGCVTNLGEIVPNETKSKFTGAIESEAFGLIVTAEPYFAVSQPSDVVVMENIFRKDAVRTIEDADAKYQLLPRGHYTANVSRSTLKPIVVDQNTPLALYEARNALWIALWAGAGTEAAELFDKAERSLQKAEAFHASRAGTNQVLTAARESIQIAENARVIALKRRSENRVTPQGTVRCGSALGA